MSNYKNILSHTDCLTQEQMQAYASNELDKQALHIVESHLIDCMFCSDALEGLQQLTAQENQAHLTEIQTSIEHLLGVDTIIEEPNTIIPETLVATDAVKNTPPPLSAHKGKKRISWVAAAGIFFLVFASGLVVFSYIHNNTNWFRPDGLAKKSPATNQIKLEKSTTNGRELETYTLDNNNLAATEPAAELDKNASSKNTLPKSKNISSATNPKSKEILAKNEANNGAATPSQPQVSPVNENREENRLAVADKIKVNEKEVIAKSDKPTEEIVRNPNMAGQTNAMDIPIYNGKMKDLNKAPAITQTESKREQKTSQYYQSEEASQDIDAIQSQGTSKKASITLSNYEQGFNAYNKANYKESIIYLKLALEEKDLKNREETMYYLAMAYEKTNNLAKARALYEQLSKSKSFENRARTRLREIPVK